ncbi:MAG: TonB-dependent receptor, partial [Armatimonadota bacterium]
FLGYDAVLAYRERLAAAVTGTLKYSFRRSRLDFQNPDSLMGDDANPFRTLINESAQHSAEFRVEADVSERSSLRLGYGRLWDRRERSGLAGAFDPDAGAIVHSPFSLRDTPGIDTAWVEAQTRVNDRLDLVVGEYWGDQTGASSVLLPKVVALYRPDRATWWSLVVNPIFRTDALELAPVEALADPRGLDFLDFTEGGAGRSYELRYQRQGSRSTTITTALAYQRVRGLLVDVEDPALSGLPTRVLIDRGDRWVADAGYEQWLTDAVTGRLWARWQTSTGRFPEAQVSDTEWPYTPEWQAGGRLDYIDASGLRVGLETVWVGRRFHDPQNVQRVDDYPLVNLRIQYQRNLHENYFVDLINLADREYESFAGFPQPGRTVVAGVEYRF